MNYFFDKNKTTEELIEGLSSFLDTRIKSVGAMLIVFPVGYNIIGWLLNFPVINTPVFIALISAGTATLICFKTIDNEVVRILKLIEKRKNGD